MVGETSQPPKVLRIDQHLVGADTHTGVCVGEVRGIVRMILVDLGCGVSRAAGLVGGIGYS
jgi:hypothetical protein